MATPSVATSAATKSKCKRKVLTIDDKVAVIKQLETCTAAVIAEQLGVGKSTISDIKKNRVEILQFKQRMSDFGMNKKAKVMKVGEDSLHDSAVYLSGSSRKEVKVLPFQDQYFVKKQCNCTRRCMVKMQNSEAVRDGSGGSARDMAYVTCRSKVKNCQLIQMPENISFPPSMTTLKRSILLFIRYLIAMKLVLILGYCQTRHWLLILNNQLMGARKVKTGSP